MISRFTPTCVGTTTNRVVGGHQRRFTPTCVGTTEHQCWINRRYRFTPTCVGTTQHYTAGTPYSPVYPHVRGDDIGNRQQMWSKNGLPPRAWGRPNMGTSHRLRCRFTPTCVGTTFCTLLPSLLRWVYPHVRGDDALFTKGAGRRFRFTPTCVGTTHKRFLQFDVLGGLPPRAWGRLMAIILRPQQIRFTPTCVGTTSCHVFSSAMISVYPHVRGDDKGYPPHGFPSAGLPPRAWGRLGRGLSPLLSLRFTPTCVGTTYPGINSSWTLRFTPTCVGTTKLA